MTLLEEDYGYAIKIAYKLQGEYKEQPETFKFRVERS
jgi:membrane glycosyltransferase